MEANVLHQYRSSKSPTPFLILNHHSPFNTQNQISLPLTLGRQQFLRAARPTIKSNSSSSNNNSNGEDGNTVPSISPPGIPPSPQDTVEIRFRRGSRKKSMEKLDTVGGGGNSTRRPSPPKDWDSMTLGEKALELYVGEKGLLFWLNKFAYASIFIIIGAWILFRFVGPSLGLYQLDTPPLSPSKLLK